MEDQEFKDIFKAYNPELPSQSLFMARLERNLDSVEIVKEHTRKIIRMNSIAIVVALAVGFISGFLLSLSLPAIGKAMKEIGNVTANTIMLNFLCEHYYPIMLTLIAATASFLSLNTFDLVLLFVRKKE